MVLLLVLAATATHEAAVPASVMPASVVPNIIAGCTPIDQLPAGCPAAVGDECPRCYNNTMPDYTPGARVDLRASTLTTVAQLHSRYIDMMLDNYLPGDARSANVYIGSAGAALNFLKLYAKTGNESHLATAKRYTDAALQELPALETTSRENGYASFMWAPAGVLAVVAVTYSHLADASTAAAAIDRMHSIIVANNATHNDFLPGRAGLLFAARFVVANNPLDLTLPWTDEELIAVAQAIISAGTSPDRTYMQWQPPSNMKVGLGTTHGTCGVVTELLYVPGLLTNRSAVALIEATLDHVVSMQFTTGNFPEQYENPLDDVLVQWDHGAPGVSVTLLLASKMLNKTSYLQSAQLAQDCVWRRGLLTKGLQNCHGISGNVYTMMIAHQVTGDVKYLYRALRFVEFVVSHPSLSDPALMRQMTPGWVSWTFWPASYQASIMLWTDILTKDAKQYSMTGYQALL